MSSPYSNTELKQRVVSVILAGGRGSRLGGVRKGDIRIGNFPLWSRLASALSNQSSTILLSTGSWEYESVDNLLKLPDLPIGLAGPAAGLMAAARWCRDNDPHSLLLSVSVDSPLFPDDFAARAHVPMESGMGCVVASYGGREYPTNALWKTDALLAELESIPPAPRGPRLRDIQAALVAYPLDYSEILPRNPFAGVNELRDLLALQRQL